jgi:RNA polymerase sigma-70 factor (ECF subfamily)
MGSARFDQSVQALHSQYADWLERVASRRFGSAAAEDLCQEVWTRIAQLHRLDHIRHPKAYLAGTIGNIARSRVRDRPPSELERFFRVPTAEQASQVEAAILREIVCSLSPSLRDVFVLSRFTGLTNAEIAERLGISVKTVEWRMTKALAHCATQLRR